MSEQRYQAILAVIAEGRAVKEVASQWGVSRQTMHTWLAKYEAGGLEGLGDGSHRPASCPHQIGGEVEAMVLELRRSRPYWGARRLAGELARRGLEPAPSESAVYRCLVRAGVIDPAKRHRRKEIWKRWERARPMELWQMDVVGGFLLADGTTAKALTGAQGDAALFTFKVVGGDRLRRLLIRAKLRSYYEVPWPVADYDTAPSDHRDLLALVPELAVHEGDAGSTA